MSGAGDIELRAGPMRLGLRPAVGGSIAYLRQDKDDGPIDWLRPAPAEPCDDPLQMACFPLVPFSNRIRDGRFAFRGRAIELPRNFGEHPHTIHGQGWQAPWQVAARTAASATLRYEHRPDTWPFAYAATQTFSLSDTGLAISMSLTNTGEGPMPAGLGLHPYFPRAGGARVQTRCENVWLIDDEAMPTALVPVPAEWPLATGLDVGAVALDNDFSGWDGHAEIAWPRTDRRLTMTADGASFLVVFTPPGEPFFCVEPVSHATDAVNLAASRDDTGFSVLAPGETRALRLHLKMES